MEEQKQESGFLKRHRMSALWNGVIIGMGFSWLLTQGALIGILPLALGIVMEVLQRKRLDRAQ